jgi:hypothetical protein
VSGETELPPRASLYLAARRRVGVLLRRFPAAKRLLVRIEVAVFPRNAPVAGAKPGASNEPPARIPARRVERVTADLERAIRHRVESADRPT